MGPLVDHFIHRRRRPTRYGQVNQCIGHGIEICGIPRIFSFIIGKAKTSGFALGNESCSNVGFLLVHSDRSRIVNLLRIQSVAVFSVGDTQDAEDTLRGQRSSAECSGCISLISHEFKHA